MTPGLIDVVPHPALRPSRIEELRRLFDGEYLTDFGAWDPSQSNGYAPQDVHLVAREGTGIVGHVGWAHRTIFVGAVEVGGVLVSENARGIGLGERLLLSARRSVLDADGIQFGYLGCREAVAPFYWSCGWRRISATGLPEWLISVAVRGDQPERLLRAGTWWWGLGLTSSGSSRQDLEPAGRRATGVAASIRAEHAKM